MIDTGVQDLEDRAVGLDPMTALEAVLDASTQDKVTTCLSLAGHLLEIAAFEAAREDRAVGVTDLILLAARLEEIAAGRTKDRLPPVRVDSDTVI